MPSRSLHWVSNYSHHPSYSSRMLSSRRSSNFLATSSMLSFLSKTAPDASQSRPSLPNTTNLTTFPSSSMISRPVLSFAQVRLICLASISAMPASTSALGATARPPLSCNPNRRRRSAETPSRLWYRTISRRSVLTNLSRSWSVELLLPPARDGCGKCLAARPARGTAGGTVCLWTRRCFEPGYGRFSIT